MRSARSHSGGIRTTHTAGSRFGQGSIAVRLLHEASICDKSPTHSVTEAICSVFGSIVKVSHHYQPITAILYASRMATVASAIQADKV